MAQPKSASKKPQPKKLTPEDEAKKLKGRLVLATNGDFKVIAANVADGAKALAAADTVLRSQLKAWDAQGAKRYAALGAAFRRAAHEIARNEAAPNPVLPAALEEAWPLRRTLLARAQIARAEGLVDQALIDSILKGAGGLDCADDLDDLAELFEKTFATTGKALLVTEAMLARARELASTIRKGMRPEKQQRFTDAQLRAARVQRDRLYTLLTLAHEELWPFAALAFGRADVERAFPAPLSRRVDPAPEPAKPADVTAPAVPKAKAKAKAAPAAEPAADPSSETTPTGDAQAQTLR